MVQRSAALCDGRYIGIEYIYDVIDGKQINIPERVKEVRKLGKENKLFCPCGCGNNLTLYAGDRNVRAQHFRIKCGTGENRECVALEEGQVYTDSMVVLKCWFSEKLKTDDIETRVPIDMVEETTRKPEFSVLSRGCKLGLRYWKTGADIREDRLDVLQGNLSGIRVVYVADASNSPADGQYPETLMKIQEKQGYCLLLSVQDIKYENADMRAVFYGKDIDGFWRENCLVKGKIRDFDISEDLSICYQNRSLEDMLTAEKADFVECQEAERLKREETEKRRLEKEKREREAAEIVRLEQEERKRRFEEELRAQRRLSEEELKRRNEEEQIRKKEAKLKQESEYFEIHPGTAAVFQYLSGLKSFSGNFAYRQIDGSQRTYLIEVTGEKPTINVTRNRIEFVRNKVCFYVEETAAGCNTRGCQYAYMIVRTERKDRVQIEKDLEKVLRVVKDTACRCKNHEGYCQHNRDGICIYENYCMFRQYE